MAYTMGTLSGAIVAVVLVALAINRFLPQIPLMSAMILAPPGSNPGVKPDEPLLRPELMTGMAATSGAGRVAVGARGTAITVLRPAGKAQIEDEMFDVISDGPFIERGAAVEVVEASRNRIIVREV
jgi:membrane-bound serine protease (ClpP class)